MINLLENILQIYLKQRPSNKYGQLFGLINEKMSDDEEIKKRMRGIYATGNSWKYGGTKI